MKLTLVSICMALVVMALSVEAAPGAKKLSFPLQKNSAYIPNARSAVAKAAAKYLKHQIQPLASHNGTASTDGTGKVPVTDYKNDIEYYGLVGIGTPAQNFKINFDTGSSDLWIASTLCSSCTSHTRYNSAKSSSYQPDGRTWKISYGDGSTASGILAYDTVNLGGLFLKKQSIELAKVISSSFITNPIDGLLGLGFSSITTVAGIKTPLDNLLSQGLISSPIFGVHLGKASQGGGGEYIFGGSDSTKYTGPVTTVPVDKSQGYWTISVGDIKAGITSFGSFKGILDTGTTLLVFTDAYAKKVASYYGARDNGDGTFIINCNTSSFKPLVFTINGATFTIPASDLLFVQEGSTCYASFGYAGLPFAILGDVFLKNNYVTYNFQVPSADIAKSINQQ